MLFCLVCLSLTSLCLGQGWSCDAFTYQNDVWIQSSYGANVLFQYRIGAGGDVAEMRQAGGSDLLAPSYAGEKTDRVIQLVFWDFNITQPAPSCDPRYNVNQAGTSDNIFTPTTSVEIQNTEGGNCSVTILSYPQDQWCPNLRKPPFFDQGSYPMRTQYTLFGAGYLSIRRSILIDAPKVNGNPAQLQNPYIEAWTPFGFPVFDVLALAFDGSDPPKPTWWYNHGNIPSYPAFPVQKTSGYGTVFRSEGGVAVSIVFGTMQFVACLGETACKSNGNGGYYELNSMPFDTGICVLPGMHPGPLLPDDLLDQLLIVIPRPSMDKDMLSEVNEVLSIVNSNPPTLYRNCSLPSALASVKSTLENVRSQQGVRTDSLGLLVAR